MTFYRNKKAALAFSALAIGIASISTQAYAASQIMGVDISQPSFNVTQLRFNFEGSPVTPVAYQQAGSNQLVLDFKQVTSTLPRNAAINAGIINDVTTLASDGTTRLMLNLKSAATYSSRIDGNQLVLDIVDMGASSPVGTAAAPQTMNVTVNPLLSPANAQTKRGAYEGISSVSYRANGGGGDISIALTNEVIPVDVQRQGNKIVVRTTGASIPRHLLRRQNAGGLVASIDANNQGQNGVITINMSGDYEYQAYQSGSQLQISVKPPKLLREPTIEEKVYRGEPLSMEFQDVPIRAVLHTLSDFTGQNIVAGDDVTGNITLRLINVPHDQALDIILKSKGLDKRTNGNVTLVRPAAVLAAEEAKILEDKKKIVDLAPLRQEYIRLNYAKAEAVFELFEKAASNGSRSDSSNNNVGLLSPRGSVIVDTRTNTLIINDTSESINNIRAMIEKIDIPVSQVMIEARIVNATEGFSKAMGVRWGVLHANRNMRVGGSETTLWNLREPNNNGIPTIERPANLNVDLGIGNAAGRIAFGLLNISDTLLDLELSAMQADNRGEVISSPKVLTSDKQKARILSGEKIPYSTSALNGATTISFVDAALVLEATPNITPDGKIGLDLMVSNGRPSRAFDGAGPISVAEDSIQTNVVLEDGQTIVLGGVYRSSTSNGITKVPFLGDLPYVGRLFKTDTKENTKQELLIFVTPKLVNDGTSRIN